MSARDFQGVLFDILDEVIIERAPCLRATYAEAIADARALAAAADDGAGVDDSLCFVLVDGLIAYSEAEAA